MYGCMCECVPVYVYIFAYMFSFYVDNTKLNNVFVNLFVVDAAAALLC